MPLRGFMEPPALTADSSGTVYMATMGWLETEEKPFGAFQTSWENGNWSPLTLLERPAIGASQSDESDGGSEFTSLTVAEGNHLHTVWELELAEIWASSLRTDAPAVPPQPMLPAKEDLATGVTEPATPVPTYPPGGATPAPAGTAITVPTGSPYNSTDPVALALLMGVVPAAFLVGLTILIYWMRRRT